MKNLLITCLGGVKVIWFVMAANIWPEKQSLFLLLACIYVFLILLFIIATGPQAKRVAVVIRLKRR